MSDAERVALGVTLAGKNQYKVLASVMSNFSTATEATAAALNSSGSAAKENAKYMESIEARVTAVNAAFQKMSTAVVDSDLVKGILDIVKAMAEFGGTDFGAAVTQFVLLSGLSWGGLSLLGQSILPSVMASFGATEAAIVGFKAALSTSLPIIMAISAAIVGLVAIVKAVKEAYDEANPSVETAALDMKNAQESLKTATDNYEQAKQKLKELNETRFEDRTAEIQNEIERLRALVRYYEELKNYREGVNTASAATYSKAVENQGFESGYRVTMPVFTGKTLPEGIKEVREYTRVFQDHETAVIAAAAASAQFNNYIVDISDIGKAEKELTLYGASFERITKSTTEVQSQLEDVYSVIENGKKLTPSIVDEYNDLIQTSEQYSESLQIMKDNGIELTSEQEEFLSIFNKVTEAYGKYIETQAEAQGLTKEEIESRYEAASALSAYAQELINAANAYQTFKDRLEASGDYDDSFKGFSSILSEIISEFDAGQIGSQKFLTGLELLTGQTFTSAEAVEYMNTHLDTLKTLFGDSESGGMGLLTILENLGYATLDTDGNLQVSIDDFKNLANELGISEGALYSLTEALRIMGIDFQYNVEDILSNIEGLGDGITSIQDGITHVDFEAFVDQAQKLGMTNEEILVYKNLLEQAANTKLDNVEAGMNALSAPTKEGASEVSNLNSELDNVESFDGSGVASSLDAIGDAATTAAGKVGALDQALSGLSPVPGNAEGTSHAKAGASLVNEEGPELIQSGDEAYIAGGGYPTVTKLKEGDRVYTAEETKNILGGKLLKGSIQAHALGARGITDTGTGGSGGSSGGFKTGITSAATTVLSKIFKDLDKSLKSNGSKSDSGSSSSSSSSKSSKDEYKAEFDEWLKAKKHALAMDEIAEEEYYRELEQMNDKYFKDKKDYQDEYWKYQEQIYSWEKKQEEEKAKAAEKAAEEAKKAYENEFSSWLKEQDHALAMDMITQEEYYQALEIMNNQYFKDKEEYQDKYWQYEEKIYSWRKKQAEEEAKEQEQALKDQIELEKKLNDLAKAKASRVKVFQDGQFRYVNDRDALAKAQEALSGYASGTFSASGGLSLVGENGAEMRVLNKGDGILPSNITKNLWSWGSISPNDFSKNGVENYNFDINNISLPNVNDANNFVKGLKAFALQYAAQRGS